MAIDTELAMEALGEQFWYTAICMFRKFSMIFAMALSFLSASSLLSCTESLDSNTAAGEYVYQYKTGEVELIQINHNKTFVHELYGKYEDYANRKVPHFSKNGIYSIDKNILTTNSWTMCYDMTRPGSPLNQPYETSRLAFIWYPSDKKVDAALVYTEDGYYFRRMKDRKWRSAEYL